MISEAITAEIIKELMTLKDTSEVSNEQVLVLTKGLEVQMAQKAVLESIRDAKDFDFMERDRQKLGQNTQ